MTATSRSHDFAPINPAAYMGGPCDDCGQGQWAPQHQRPAVLSIFDALDEVDTASEHGPARLAAAREYARACSEDIAAIGACGGRLDALTWAAWTHAAFERIAAVLDGRVTSPARLALGDASPVRVVRDEPEQHALAV